MLRFQCSQLVTERLDPLVNPGLLPSPHLHQIVGGSSFNATLSHDLAALSTCTSCTFLDDASNYWTAVLFFRARNGTYKRVPQVPGLGLGGRGGITVYYIPPRTAGAKTTAFRPGFRMLVGDVGAKTAAAAAGDPKICHRCMPISGEHSHLNCAAPDAVTLPGRFCPGGIRSVVTFPTCWDGVRLDSVDHRSHMAYPVKGTETDPFDYDGGTCPESHPVKVPQVMYEVQWDTTQFNDRALWPEEDGLQPFVWSSGDKHGYSQHGDYVFGWKGDALQRAMDNRCFGEVCEGLPTQTPEKAAECTKPVDVDEDIDSCEITSHLVTYLDIIGLS
ncbi:hypothetical protein B0T18DRAFT_320261 [Schizothecium vesticola]|uniref:DUF1996 domain-containing protein n=1 Tax=Schizothecium vesticola TaxID=314040 RepID=A0AA40K9W3_9PEZI|nr:hypothetical protein B0T18DRAFT_320261 [Schizothecium vesticola]